MKEFYFYPKLKGNFIKLLTFLLLFPLSGLIESVSPFSHPSYINHPRQIEGENLDNLIEIFSKLNTNPNWQPEVRIKRDKNGCLWLLEPKKEGSLGLQRLNPISSQLYNLAQPADSSVHSFDFSFDFFNTPWFVWVETGSIDKLCLMAYNRKQPILIDSGPPFTITSPSICIDIQGTVWIFYVKTVLGIDRIFFTRFYYSYLSTLEFFPKSQPFSCMTFPCMTLSSEADSSGHVWLTWSAYDGSNYEIFVSCYDGQRWSPQFKISSSSQADLFPRFYYSLKGNLALAWIETGKNYHLWLTDRKDNEWQKPRLIWSDFGPITAYELIINESQFILCLKKNKNYSLHFLPKENSHCRKDIERQSAFVNSLPFISSQREDNAYIAFGDSITNGMIITNLDPEKYYYNGYPPRLEKRLLSEYGVGVVINAASDGELTAQGLSRLPGVLNTFNARYLLLMEGFNDVIFLDISLDTVIFNLKSMINQAFQKGVFPFLATITPRRDYIWYTPICRNRHLALNEKIRQLALELKVPLVDQYVAMESYPAADGGLLSLFSIDYKHPNEKGYQVIAETWFKEIQAFPFPPHNLKVVGRDFVWEAKFIRFLSQPEFLSGQNQTGLGNFIFWEANPKIRNFALIAGYRLYRKKAGDSDSAYALIATINDNLHYFDKNVILSLQYSYLVSTYRTDGVEGPAAGPVTR